MRPRLEPPAPSYRAPGTSPPSSEPLAHGERLADDIYAEMVSGLPAEGHSLGVFAADPPSETGISNAGALPGFTAYMQYDPATGDAFVLLLNDDSRSPEHLAEALLAEVES
jgi:hypothetical protein